MKQNPLLLFIVVVQAILIIVLLIYRANRDPQAQESPANVKLKQVHQEPSATLEDALQIAREGLEHMREHLHDYSARIKKRELVDGALAESEMEIRVQCRKHNDDVVTTPMRVYLKFLKPENTAGREVIWAEDKYDGKLLAHEAGLLNLAYVALDPNGDTAMEGNRYPISEIGLLNLVAQLIERGKEIVDVGAKVEFSEHEKISDCDCQKIRIELPQPHETLDFKIAEIFFDTERRIPIRYSAFGWPDGSNAPPLLEEYTYCDVKTNVGLGDVDFDPQNESYDFPSVMLPF